jgi:hypothetical protein
MAEQNLVIVFDQSISPRICRALEGFCLDDRSISFQVMTSGTKDSDWLDGEFPSEPPHVVIAKDSVLRPHGQTLAWLRGGLTVVIVDGRLGNVTLEHLAAILIRWWPAIRATIKASPRQSAFIVPVRFAKRDRLPKWVRKPRKKRKATQPPASKKRKASDPQRLDNRQLTLELDRQSDDPRRRR